MKLGDGKPKEHGSWDYYGALDPAHKRKSLYGGIDTFSVGVFQWWKKKTGLGTKRLPAIKRIKGRVNNPKEVYLKALTEIAKRGG